ncbi:hypothetical protein [Microseira sp. BLCC-F43]
MPLDRADENPWQKMLHKLIGNAIKFTDSVFVEGSAEVIISCPVKHP